MADNAQQDAAPKKAQRNQNKDGQFVGLEDAADAGYFGTRNTDHPDEAYALTSGPDAPTGENGPE